MIGRVSFIVSLALAWMALSIDPACAETRSEAEASAQPALAAAQHAAPSVGAATFDASQPARLEVLRVKTGHLLVKPVVNGVAAGWFIFDTGAGICVISTPQLDKFHLESAGEIDSNGIGGAQQSGLYRASTLVLGPLTMRDHSVMSTDLSFLKEHLGEEIVGVIGYGVLAACVAEIDPLTPSVALHDPKRFELKACEWVTIDLVDRIPALKARSEDHEGLFHIDTGANNAVSFSAQAVSKWKLLEGRDVQDAKLGGVGGFIAAKKGKLAWFELGGLRQENVLATFPLEAKGVLGGERIDGSIGQEALRPFVLVTDYAHERMAFRTRAVAPEAR